jgi:hypothetical protein
MSGFGIQKRGTSPILKQAGSPGPTVPILPENFSQGPKLPDDIAAKQKPRDTFKKGGRPGLWANINARKKAGTSRPKSESTISPKAYANMKAGFPKKKK